MSKPPGRFASLCAIGVTFPPTRPIIAFRPGPTIASFSSAATAERCVVLQCTRLTATCTPRSQALAVCYQQLVIMAPVTMVIKQLKTASDPIPGVRVAVDGCTAKIRHNAQGAVIPLNQP